MPPRGSAGPSTIGILVVHAECSVRDLDGAEVPAGQIGELWVRDPLLLQGDWNRPEGWFTTGDAAQVDDDGIFHIVERWKDMYISGGKTIHPAELESVLYQHPELVLISVVGVPATGGARSAGRSSSSLRDPRRRPTSSGAGAASG